MREKRMAKSSSVLIIKTWQIWPNPQTTVVFSRAIQPNKMRKGSWGQATKRVTLSQNRNNKKAEE